MRSCKLPLNGIACPPLRVFLGASWWWKNSENVWNTSTRIAGKMLHTRTRYYFLNRNTCSSPAQFQASLEILPLFTSEAKPVHAQALWTDHTRLEENWPVVEHLRKRFLNYANFKIPHFGEVRQCMDWAVNSWPILNVILETIALLNARLQHLNYLNHLPLSILFITFHHVLVLFQLDIQELQKRTHFLWYPSVVTWCFRLAFMIASFALIRWKGPLVLTTR